MLFSLVPETTSFKWMEMVISNRFLYKDRKPIETRIWIDSLTSYSPQKVSTHSTDSQHQGSCRTIHLIEMIQKCDFVVCLRSQIIAKALGGSRVAPQTQNPSSFEKNSVLTPRL